MADTRQEALSEAFDRLSSEPAAEPAPAPAAEAAPEPAPAEAAPVAPETEGRARDGQGRFAKQDRVGSESPAIGTPKAKAGAPPAPAQEKGAAVSPAAVPSPPTPEAPKYKPPQSWKPMAREKWGALPLEVQEEIARREGEVPRALQEAADAKRFRDGFLENFRPYETVARAAGQEPLQWLSGLAQTAAGLQMGSPKQKADLGAYIIKQFGIDVNMLAAALDGQTPAAPPPQQQMYQDPRAMVREEFASLQQQAIDRRAVGEVEAFAAKHEFANDPAIRRRMSALISSEIEAGVEISLEDAYNQAVQSHSEYRAVMDQRKAAETAAKAQADAQRARTAAVSIRSSPTAAPAAQPKGREAALRAAYDALASR